MDLINFQLNFFLLIKIWVERVNLRWYVCIWFYINYVTIIIGLFKIKSKMFRGNVKSSTLNTKISVTYGLKYYVGPNSKNYICIINKIDKKILLNKMIEIGNHIYTLMKSNSIINFDNIQMHIQQNQIH